MTPARTGLTRYTVGLPLLIALLLALSAADFRQPQNLLNFGGQVAALLIASLGQMCVTLVAGIDLSVGAVMSLASGLLVLQSDPVLAVAMALAMGAAVGVVNGLGVAVAGVHPLVMTLSTATFLQGLCHMVLPMPGGQVPPPLVAASPLAAAVVALGALTTRTRFGLHLFAVGSQPRSAYLNGVRVRAVTVTAYVLCSVMASVAGIFLAARVATGDPNLGTSFPLETVAAVALGGVQLTGGVGSVAGVVAGTLSLGLLTNGLNVFGISPFLRGVLTGALLLAAVSVQRRRHVGL